MNSVAPGTLTPQEINLSEQNKVCISKVNTRVVIGFSHLIWCLNYNERNSLHCVVMMFMLPSNYWRFKEQRSETWLVIKILKCIWPRGQWQSYVAHPKHIWDNLCFKAILLPAHPHDQHQADTKDHCGHWPGKLWYGFLSFHNVSNDSSHWASFWPQVVIFDHLDLETINKNMLTNNHDIWKKIMIYKIKMFVLLCQDVFFNASQCSYINF